MPFTVDATTLQTNLRDRDRHRRLTVTGGSGVFLVTFPNALGNVDLLDRDARRQARRPARRRRTAATASPAAAPRRTRSSTCTSTPTTTGGNGYFTVHLGFQETKALPLNVCASGAGCLDEAIKTAFTDIDALHSLLSVTATSRRLRRRVQEPRRQRRRPRARADAALHRRRQRRRPAERAVGLRGHVLQRRRRQRQLNVNINATTLAAFHPGDVVGHLNIRDTTPGVLSSQTSRSPTSPAARSSSASAATGRSRSPGTLPRPATASRPPTRSTTARSRPRSSCSSRATRSRSVSSRTATARTRSPSSATWRRPSSSPISRSRTTRPATVARTTRQQIDISEHNGQDTSFSTFSLDYTYPLVPLGLALDPNAVGALVAGTYSYVVTAVTPHGRVAADAGADDGDRARRRRSRSTWGDVPNVDQLPGLSRRRADRHRASATSRCRPPRSSTTRTASPTAGRRRRRTTTATGTQTTIPIAIDAAAGVVAGRPRSAAVDRQGQQRQRQRPRHLDRRGPLHDRVRRRPRRPDDPHARRQRLVAALERAPRDRRRSTAAPIRDRTRSTLIGGTHELARQRLRLRRAGDGGDSLTVNGTDFADVFLLRAATADNGLAFIALINGPTPLTPERERPGRAHQLQQRARVDRRQRRQRRRPVLHGRHARLDHAQRRRGQRLLPGRPALQVAPHAGPRRHRARGRLRDDRHDAGLAEQRHQRSR